MKTAIRNRLIAAAIAIAAGVGGGTATYVASETPSDDVLLAMEIGAFYESSGRHIGTPYVDNLGKGKPLTVCNGVTGKGVVAGRYYTEEDCKALELPRYKDAERAAKRLFRYWDSYNSWVRASMIDMIYNLGEPAVSGSTMVRLANAGDLAGACQQMPRWVRGTVNGQTTVLPGLVDRRATTAELCTQWGRDGHFSAGLLARSKKP